MNQKLKDKISELLMRIKFNVKNPSYDKKTIDTEELKMIDEILKKLE